MIKKFLRPILKAEPLFAQSSFKYQATLISKPSQNYSFFNKRSSIFFNKDNKNNDNNKNDEPNEQRIDPNEDKEKNLEGKNQPKKSLKEEAEELLKKLGRSSKNEKEKEENKETEEEEQETKKPKESSANFIEDMKNYFKKKQQGHDPKMPKPEWKHIALAGLGGILVAQYLYETFGSQNTISYNEFIKKYLETDRVKKIQLTRVMGRDNEMHSYAIIHTEDDQQLTLLLGNADHFLENLERVQAERGKAPERYIPVEIGHGTDMSKIAERFIRVAYVGLIAYLIYSGTRRMGSSGGGMGGGRGGRDEIFNYGKSGVQIFGLDKKIPVRFKDVAGLDEAKVEITEFVDFLKKPKRFKDLGAKIPRGALLAGPPGTGKTLLAKAAAGEAGVPFLYISGSDFVEMFVGVGASRVRDLFKKAKEHAPSIIFIDEIDAVGRKRESKIGGNDERDNTLNQLLVEMDGFGTDSNVVVLAATNRSELLDNALTRPGRFDRSIDVQLPDIDGRKQIFMVHLKPLTLDPEKPMEEFAKRLATLTPGFSGADISNLCNEAAILAARKNKRFVSTDEFESAAERVMAGLEKKKIISEEERRTVAVHESGHAVVSWFLEGGAPLLKLTIIPRSKGSLGFAQYLPNESSLETKEELMDRICTILGGRCSEELFNQKITTGAYDDLRKAYDIAHAMITKFGMSEKIGFLGFAEDQYVKKVSEKTAKDIDDEIKNIIDVCTVRTRELVRKYKTEIEKLSGALLEKETLDLNNIVKILGERPFPPKSNFKAYLEHKEQDEKEKKEKNWVDEENNNSGGRPQESTA